LLYAVPLAGTWNEGFLTGRRYCAFSQAVEKVAQPQNYSVILLSALAARFSAACMVFDKPGEGIVPSPQPVEKGPAKAGLFGCKMVK
jgi:hypothetical protein